MAKYCYCCQKTLGFLTGENRILPDSYQPLCDKCYSVFGVNLNKIRALQSESEVNDAYQEAVEAIKSSSLKEKDYVLSDLGKAYQNRLSELNIMKQEKEKEFQLLDAKKQEEKRQEEHQAYVRKHYTELSENFLMTTGFDFEGYRITKYLGVISDGVVQGTGFVSELSADFNDFFGTESNTFATKMKQCREAALKKIKDAAMLRNANALIAIDFDTMTFRNNMIGVMATGTAVQIEKVSSSI